MEKLIREPLSGGACTVTSSLSPGNRHEILKWNKVVSLLEIYQPEI